MHELKTLQQGDDSKNNYHELVQTKEFRDLLSKKKRFIFPVTIFFLIFYFSLPLLAGYTKILHKEALDSIPWVWLFSLLQFVLVWFCGWIYVKKSEKYDVMASEILNKYKERLKL